MKKIFLLYFILFLNVKGFSQYFETSSFLVSDEGSIFCFNNDQDGNCFATASERMIPGCVMCGWFRTIKWVGPSGNGSITLPECYPNLKMTRNAIGDIFAFGTFSPPYNSPTIFGTLLYTIQNKKALIKYGNPSWAKLIIANEISVTDSGYCFTIANDSIHLFSPAGILLWSRSGGGSQIYAKDNLSYIVRNNTGITKYQSNGNVAWQSPLTAVFTVIPKNLIAIKQGTTVYNLDASNGLVVSTHASASQGTIFDNEGNGYIASGNVLTKYDSAGMVWQTSIKGADFANIGFDRHNNLYFANNYDYYKNQHGVYVPVTIQVPPNIMLTPLPIAGTPTAKTAFYGKINQKKSLHSKITTGIVKALCKESTTLVPFTVNQFLFSYVNGFRAELSDGSGDFTNPIILGTGFKSPITCSTPFFNISGTKYKIRVVSNSQEGISKPAKITQFAFPPKAIISTPTNYYIPGQGTRSCSPAILVANPGNYKYNWLRKLLNENNFSTYPSGNDTISINYGYVDSYSVIVTDTATGCLTQSGSVELNTATGTAKPDFYLPDTLCINDGPVELASGFGGAFNGNYISENKFYPDSAGIGIHAVNWHSGNPASCFTTGDTTKYVYVDSCTREIHSVMLSPSKNTYCIGDTITASFLFDSTAFNSGNKFKVQLGEFDNGKFYTLFNNLGTSVTSPVTFVATNDIYSDYDLRLRIVSTSPFVKPAYNYEGSIQFGYKGEVVTTVNGNPANCGNNNSLLGIVSGEANYLWHYKNQVMLDSFPGVCGSYLLADKSGDYSAEIVTNHGCKSFSDTIHIGANVGFPVFSITPSSATICNGDSLQISLTTDSTNMLSWFKWDAPVFPADPYNLFITPGYGAVLTSPTGCFVKKSEAVDFKINYAHPYVTITAGGSLTFCQGKSVTLSTTNNADYIYQWTNNGANIAGAVLYNYNAKSTGNYNVMVTDSVTKCSNNGTNPQPVLVKPSPVANITPAGPLTFCAGDSVILLADTAFGYKYSWIRNNAYLGWPNMPAFTATTAGNYKVEVTDTAGCKLKSAPVSVTVPCREPENESIHSSSFSVIVYPNPSSGNFAFEINGNINENMYIDIFDVTGRKIFFHTFQQTSFTLENSILSPGIFIAVISSGLDRRFIRLVKTK